MPLPDHASSGDAIRKPQEVGERQDALPPARLRLRVRVPLVVGRAHVAHAHRLRACRAQPDRVGRCRSSLGEEPRADRAARLRAAWVGTEASKSATLGRRRRTTAACSLVRVARQRGLSSRPCRFALSHSRRASSQVAAASAQAAATLRAKGALAMPRCPPPLCSRRRAAAVPLTAARGGEGRCCAWCPRERGLISTVRTCSTPPSVRAHLVRARVRVRVGVHLEARCLCSGVVRVRAKVGCVRAHRAAAPQPNLT